MARDRQERGWRLTKTSWRLVRRDPTLVPLTLLAIGGSGLVFMATIAVANLSAHHNGARLVLLGVLGIFASAFAISFLCAAVAHAASASFDGMPLTMREAFAEARLSLRPLLGWSLVALAVTFVLQLARADSSGGALLGSGAGLLWSFFALYAIPIIALTGCGAGEAIAESADIARRRWAEQLSGAIAIGGISVLVAIGLGILFAIGVSNTDSGSALVAALFIFAGGLGLACTAVFSFATSQVFTVAMLRLDSGELSLAELESPPPQTPIGGSAVLRTSGIVAGLLVAAVLVGALLPHNRNRDGIYTPDNGYYYATFQNGSEVPLPAGAPVLYGDRKIGMVIGSRYEASRLVIWFRSDPALEPTIEDNSKRVMRLNGYYYLRIGPPSSAKALSGSV